MTETKDLFQEHDRLFHAVFSSKERAAELIGSLLPEALCRQVDFSTIEPRPSKYTGVHLEARHSDVLFDVKAGGRQALVYVLLEHQSSDEPFMVVRLLLYMALIWDGMRREETVPRYLPPIIPIVVHHSERRWKASTRFEDAIDPDAWAVEVLSPYVPRFEFILDDLSKVSDEKLKSRGLAALSALALWALRDSRNPKRFFRHLRAWAGLLNALAENPETASGAALLLEYISHVLGHERTEELTARLSELSPAAEQAMQTIAQAIEEKGREEGREEGQRSLVTQLLTSKFGALPADVASRLEAASGQELARYAVRLLDAKSLGEVFED